MYNNVAVYSPLNWCEMHGFSHTMRSTVLVPALGAFPYPTMTSTLADTVTFILTDHLALADWQRCLVVMHSVDCNPAICINIVHTHTKLYTSVVRNIA